jgi:hypothetical protein
MKIFAIRRDSPVILQIIEIRSLKRGNLKSSEKLDGVIFERAFARYTTSSQARVPLSEKRKK